MYTYFFKSESGDSQLTVTDKKYDSAVEFMKEEAYGEYEGWAAEGYPDDEIPYEEFEVIDSSKEGSIYF